MQSVREVLFLQKLLANKKACDFKILIFSLFIISFFLHSCNTWSEKPRSGNSFIDYSNLSAVNDKIKNAKTLLQNGNAIDALIQAEILNINTKGIVEVAELKSSSIKKIEEDFEKNTNEEKWEDALKNFRSLVSIGKKPANWTEEKIFKKQIVNWTKHGFLPLVNLKKSSGSLNNSRYPKNFTEMLKGTITVVVDRGTRIERGIGFSDMVIGSGFFIDEQGYFITNYHVIESEVSKDYNGYSRLYIKSPDNPNIKIKAKVIGWDKLFDIALVKTELTPEVIFPLGSSEKLEVGSKIYAIGSPAGLEKTLTAGIVSTKYRRLFSVVDVMQIDAPINHGNSGGPIVDEAGLVQGVVFAGLNRNEGLNFAIPVELMKSILPALYAGGEVNHSWLGGYGNPKKIPESAEHNTGREISAVEVAYIMPTGPLAVSQIKEGSLITEFNGARVTTTEELQAQILSVAPDTIVKLRGFEKTADNKFKRKEWPVLCKARPALPGSEVLKKDSDLRAMLPIFGLYLEPTGRRKTYRVAKVEQGSFADETGFSQNDTIEINGKNRAEFNKDVIQVHIYAKKVKAGYVDSFMIISQYLDNSKFF